ncbi:ATP-binding protein [Patescibacteria group bacterium]|nr:ATP-binding protein [Patescibacteria group bacterium]
MAKNLLIIISGHPCTGKTTLSRKISNKLKLPLISKDDIKESLFDSLGVKDREWSRKLGIASFDLMYQFIETLLLGNTSFIVETPLKPEFDNEKFLNLQRKHDFEVLQIICNTDDAVLFERFKKRTESGERHPGHVDDQNYDMFKDGLLKDKHEPLNISGEIIEIDTTNFNSIDYDAIFNSIKSAKSKIDC